MPKVPPGLVAEGDARSRRTNPPQSPTQGIDWCGVMQAVHLRSNGPTTAAGAGYGEPTCAQAIPLQIGLIRLHGPSLCTLRAAISRFGGWHSHYPLSAQATRMGQQKVNNAAPEHSR